MTGGIRSLALLLATITCTTTMLTACGPYDADAQVGITVDETGSPVLVLQDCDGQIDVLTVSPPRIVGPVQPDHPRKITLTRKKPVKGITRIPMYAGGNGWAPLEPATPFKAVGDYYVSTRGSSPESHGGGVIFSLADLKTLKPGQVRHHIPAPPGVTYATARFVSSDYYWVSPGDDFAPEACR